ncbi:MAG: DNA repair protein RecO, partial [Planctomycetota bacterium]
MRGPFRYATEAIVLRTIAFAETSQVVHLATPDHGLVAALAKGARRPGPAFQGGLVLGTRGVAELTRRPRAELELLRRFRQRTAVRAAGSDLDRYYAACYVLDLLRAFFRPALPNPALYRAGRTALAAALQAPLDALPAWMVLFEARAVDATGHRPRLDACAACGGTRGPLAWFSPPAGGLVHVTCLPPGPRRRLA